MTPIVFATKGKVLLTLEREGDPWEVRFHQSKRCDEYSDRATNRSDRITKASGRWPRSVVASDEIEGFQYFVLSHNATNRNGGTAHPNEKPQALMRWLVGKLPGGTVLDPFAGSGTTAAACEAEGRDCILIEREPAYCDIIRRRIPALEAA